MSFFRLSMKSMLLTIGLSAVVIAAMTISDINTYSTEFMNDRLPLSPRLDYDSQRFIASSANAISYMDIECSDSTAAIINGNWRILLITENFSTGIKSNRIVKFTLMCEEGTNQAVVLLGNSGDKVSTIDLSKEEDINRKFQIGKIYELNHLAHEKGSYAIKLVQEVNGGNTIISAQKYLPPSKYMSAARQRSDGVEEEVGTSGVKGVPLPAEAQEFFLVSVTGAPDVEKLNILNLNSGGENGFLLDETGIIEDLNISLDGKGQVAISGTSIGDGGIVYDNAYEPVGLINRNGPSSYTIRFAQGDLKNLSFHFASQEEYEKVLLTEEDNQAQQEENKLAQEEEKRERDAEITSKKVDEFSRAETAEDPNITTDEEAAAAQEENVKSREEMNDLVSQEGFQFKNQTEEEPNKEEITTESESKYL
ncbi:MAG: hypothetical protein A2504_06160 [Bdellovibrionales bacterium RIFOXYD12_FULL_39_22]|nr:MAG: hypothetical protein A2385_08480 [Bdellovibrionales bacterium RIFOXYB1_FULL_39_21]OFZ45261.1 MAG: hypothetical protein A2485_06055 [Bdellovibrionales bacterium RIFOXYC12_FULL_39_17]OFZ45549.1 MAG: hypothetical protein A2404_03060 [Bdellovibrionales bacterium RIFOXYC1_FULL_39_130]OFZ77410.1 MAG: hypothetical protein A2560_08650 [Bdellovibrionales bacterium RIFOXYD1_FULL_39_84]OFZ91539.1 MAG: hypothetical protein A2504_06160 [Bdellovibrionales bacterium RIFOXYD12_FULL_39_22]HLE12003.1 hy